MEKFRGEKSERAHDGKSWWSNIEENRTAKSFGRLIRNFLKEIEHLFRRYALNFAIECHILRKSFSRRDGSLDFLTTVLSAIRHALSSPPVTPTAAFLFTGIRARWCLRRISVLTLVPHLDFTNPFLCVFLLSPRHEESYFENPEFWHDHLRVPRRVFMYACM